MLIFLEKKDDSWAIDIRATDDITHQTNNLSNMIKNHKIPSVQISNCDTVRVHALHQLNLGQSLTL